MERRLWKGSKVNANVRMSIRGHANEMQIGKDVIRLLGAPEYITFKLNKKMDSIMVVGVTEKQRLSFKVPDDYFLNNDSQMRVTSRSFVSGILSVNGMDINTTYHLEGVYFESNNVVIFDLNDAEKYSIQGQRIAERA